MELIVNAVTGQIYRHINSRDQLQEIAISQRNLFDLSIIFVEEGSTASTPLMVVPIPPPYTQIVLSARPNDNLTGEDLLFFADTFLPVGTGPTLRYEADLTTLTEPIADLFDENSDMGRYPCLLDIDLLVTGDPAEGRKTIVKQREFQLYRTIWQGTENVPTADVPSYPVPSALLLKTAQTLTSGELTQVRENLALGTLADQDADDVAILGGSIAGASVTGLPTPAGDDDAVTKQYVDTLFADGVKVPSGLDCSANPYYPASEAGDTYKVTVGGKIGGASGPAVEAGDLILCVVDSVSGDHATVGANFLITQTNLDQATESLLGSVRLATQAEAEVATNNTRAMTPLRTKQYVETLDRAFQSKINYLLSA
jgi:hypothetical protein